MPYQIVRNDITQMQVDAIVNPTDPIFTGLGGTDGRVHTVAGPELRKACDALPLLEEGSVAVTNGFMLPCKYVIHTVGPIWHGGDQDERRKLKNCYRNALHAALERNCETIAFPLISSGTFGYPKDKVLRIALEAISSFLMHHDMLVFIVVYDKKAYELSKKLQKDVDAFIDEHYIAYHSKHYNPYTYTYEPSNTAPAEDAPASRQGPVSVQPDKAQNLDAMLSHMDETFSTMLLRLIDESGMTDVECYKKANIDKKLFSKIRSNRDYQPTKPTVIAFAVALRLSLEETKQLLGKAGLALNHSNKFDVIVEYFISARKYNAFEINEVLYQYDQKLLGSVTA